MNFEKSFVSNFAHFLETTDGESAALNNQNLLQTSPRVTSDYENRPILSYTIPTNDCTSPSSRTKPSFVSTTPRHDHQHYDHKIRRDFQRSISANQDSATNEKAKKLAKLSCAPVVRTECVSTIQPSVDRSKDLNNGKFSSYLRSKTPTPQETNYYNSQTKNDITKSALTEGGKNNQYRDDMNFEQQNKPSNFVRMSTGRRSLQPESYRQNSIRPKTSQTQLPTTRNYKSLTLKTEDVAPSAFPQKASYSGVAISQNKMPNSIKRSRSTQGSRQNGYRVGENCELLTDQTPPSSYQNDFAAMKMDRLQLDDAQSQSSDCESKNGWFRSAVSNRNRAVQNCKPAVDQNGRTNTAGSKQKCTGTIREGLAIPNVLSSNAATRMVRRINSPSPHVEDETLSTSLAYNSQLPVRPAARAFSPSSTYSNDDINNNNTQVQCDSSLLNRFGSLRIPKTSQKKHFYSDQSSECSSERELSIGCSSGSPLVSGQAADPSDIMDNLNSANWQLRREGLASLHLLISQSPEILSESDLKRITDLFTKMFHDPHSKVFSLFLEILAQVISNYSELLPHLWLSICLHRLLGKCGNELLGSVQVKVKKVFEAIRDSFTCDHQIEVLSGLVYNHTLMHNSKSRECLIMYVRELFVSINPQDLSPSPKLNELVAGLIRLSEMYRSNDSKKYLRPILLSLFDLSPPTFSDIMRSQPRTIQDYMTKIVKQHLNSQYPNDEMSSSSSPSSTSSTNQFVMPSNNDDNYENELSDSSFNHQQRNLFSPCSSTNSSDSGAPSTRHSGRTIPSPSTSKVSFFSPKTHPQPTSLSSPRQLPQSTSLLPRPSSALSSRIQSRTTDLSVKSKAQLPLSPTATPTKVPPTSQFPSTLSYDNTDKNNNGFFTPQVIKKVSLSKATFFSPPRGDDDSGQILKTSNLLQRSQSAVEENSSPNLVAQQQESMHHHHHNHLSNNNFEFQRAAADKSDFDAFVKHFNAVDISDVAEWKSALKQFLQVLPSKHNLVTDSHALSLLVVLLSATEGVDENSLLIADCITTLLKTRDATRSLMILKTIVDRSENRNISQALRWLKFQLESTTVADITLILDQITATVLKTSDHENKSVRTLSIMTLMQLYTFVGDDIWNHMGDISDYKKNLFKMYFKKTSTSR